MAKPKRTLLDNPIFEKQCTWKDGGMRCQSDGHLSTGTLGEGPWYCRAHFAQKMKWPHYQVSVVDESQAAVDKRVISLVPMMAGESEHDWAMRCRAWVADRMKRGRFFSAAPIREPGEDQAEN